MNDCNYTNSDRNKYINYVSMKYDIIISSKNILMFCIVKRQIWNPSF